MRVLSLVFLWLLFGSVKAQLSAGDLMFVGFNADSTDNFAIVTLVNIPANSTIYFSDNEWNGSAIGSGGAFVTTTEGEMTWQTGASVINAGTVITFNETSSGTNPGFGSSIGTISGNINLNASNEVLYAYEGSDDETPTLFLSAIANSGFDMTNGTLVGTGLTSGANAIGLTGGEDVLIYNGSTICTTTLSFCSAQIADPLNWITEDGANDQSNNSIAPDFPADLPAPFTGSALPIELYSFGVKQMDRSVALIEWVTLSEVNNDYFTVEKSANLLDWEVVAVQKGAGNSTQKIAYYSTDHFPFSGITYYRLKQTDFNGEYSYSVIEAFNRKESLKNQFYPNPTKGLIYSENELSANQKLSVMSISGSDFTNQVSIQSPSTIDLSRLPSGVYLIQVDTKIYRIMKQ